MSLLTGQSLAVGVSSALGGQLQALDPPLSLATSASGGKLYTQLKKGTSWYAALLAQVTNWTGEQEVPAAHIVHGEADMRDDTSRATYAGYVAEWASDIRADSVAATGQASAPPIIICQTNSWPEYGRSAPTIGLAQVDTAISDSSVFMVGPKYQLGYGSDEMHLTSAGYTALAKLHRRAYASIATTGDWQPLRPLSASRVGSVITVQFDVPTTPLKFDTTTVTAQTNQGFTVQSDSGAETVTSVALGGDGTSVEITVSGTPGANPKVRYGFATQYGNLSDSETADSLANWCVHFEQAVT